MGEKDNKKGLFLKKWKSGGWFNIHTGEEEFLLSHFQPIPLITPSNTQSVYELISPNEYGIKSISIDATAPTHPVRITKTDGSELTTNVVKIWNDTTQFTNMPKANSFEEVPRWFWTDEKLPQITLACEAVKRRKSIRNLSKLRDDQEIQMVKDWLHDSLVEMSLGAVEHDREKKQRMANNSPAYEKKRKR